MSEATKVFVRPGVPKINTSFGRQQYGTKGQHDQCQPVVPPGELFKRRREFFSETIYRDLQEE